MTLVTIAPAWEFDTATNEVFQHNGDPSKPTRPPQTVTYFSPGPTNTTPSSAEIDLMVDVWSAKVRGWYLDRVLPGGEGKFVRLAILLFLIEGLQQFEDSSANPPLSEGPTATFIRAFNLGGKLHHSIRADPATLAPGGTLSNLYQAIRGVYAAVRCGVAHTGSSRSWWSIEYCSVKWEVTTRILTVEESTCSLNITQTRAAAAPVLAQYRLEIAPDRLFGEVSVWLNDVVGRLKDHKQTALRRHLYEKVFFWPTP